MWEEVIQVAISNGLWAVLFCSLLIYLLKDSRRRETKYQTTIEQLSIHIGKIEQLQEDIAQVQVTANEIRAKVNEKRRSAA